MRVNIKLFLLNIILISLYIDSTISVYDIAENLEEVDFEDRENTTETFDSEKLNITVDMNSKFKRDIERVYEKEPQSNSTLQSVLNRKQTFESVERNSTNELCPYFVYSPGFNMDEMADVWQAVYYKMADKLKCFKMLVKNTYENERKQYEQWYGNFNNSMDWNECHLEITSSSVGGRKHFLQGGVGDKGVMRNIIIDIDNNGKYSLQEESPDQWLMLKGLLLLRDCETGGIVMFARVPHYPSKRDIQKVLEEFGEEMTGKLMCESPEL